MAPLPSAPHVMLPIDWGAFPLTDAPTREPTLRLRMWWSAHGLDPARLWIPALGETRQIAPGRGIGVRCPFFPRAFFHIGFLPIVYPKRIFSRYFPARVISE